jgi:hypothetical protein
MSDKDFFVQCDRYGWFRSVLRPVEDEGQEECDEGERYRIH